MLSFWRVICINKSPLIGHLLVVNGLLSAAASADKRLQLPETDLYFRPSSSLSPELGVISAEARVRILESHEPHLGQDHAMKL